MEDPLDALESRWREEAETFRRYGDERGAVTCELHADELHAARESLRALALTVAEAAEVSGYSESHLYSLLSEGKLPNAGRPQAPRIRLADLPRKPQRRSRRTPVVSLMDELIAARTGS